MTDMMVNPYRNHGMTRCVDFVLDLADHPSGIRPTSVGAADVIFLAVCIPRLREENYVDLESDGAEER
jgi:hypothetical protein